MARKAFKCQDLPDDLRDDIRRMVEEGRASYSDIHAHVQTMGADVSRSAVARYGRFLKGQRADLEAARDMANELLPIGEGIDIQGLAARLIAVKILSVLMQNDIYVEEDGLSLSTLIALARAVATLQTSTLAREKYQADVKARAAQVADEVGRQASKGGLSETTIETIRSRILGLAETA